MGHRTFSAGLWRGVLTVALVALAPTLGGCRKRKPTPPPAPVAKAAEASPHFSPSELAAVCNGKGGNARAAAYAKTPGKASPAAFFLKPEDAKSFDAASMLSSRSGATKPDTRGWESATGEETQLVVCTEIVSTHKIGRHCTYDSTSSKSNDRVISELASANVRYTVLEAKTAARVGDGVLELQAPNTCEAYVRYPQSIVTGDLAPVYEMALAPLEPADAAPPKLEAKDAWMACEGKPLVGAPSVSREPGAVNKVYALEQTDDTKRWYRSDHQSFGALDDHVSIESLGSELPAIVVCETHTRAPKKIRDCTYSSGRKVALHAATWSFRVVEAASGNVLAEKTLPARSGDCPWQWDFEDGSDADATASYAAQDKLVMPLAKPAPQKQPKRSARR